MPLASAIRQRRRVRFVYEGLHRIVEPHVYGALSSGDEALRAYQVGGDSKSGHQPPWRLFLVEKIEGMVVLEETFLQTRPGYNPDDPHIVDIYAAA